MKQTQDEIYALAADRPESSNEIYTPNAWYGYARSLKTYLDLDTNYQMKAVVPHGIHVFRDVWEQDLLAKLPAIFISSPYIAEWLRTQTNKAIFVTGNYITYVDQYLSEDEIAAERRRLGKNLLAIPVHSTHHVMADYNLDAFCEYLESIAKDFNSISVLLYWKDVLMGLGERFSARGYEIVTAGHMFDELFVSRLKSIMETSSLVVSNHVGTAAGFAVSLGKPFNFFKSEIKARSIGDLKFLEESEKSIVSHPEIIELEQEFSELRGDISPRQKELIDRYWGDSYVRSKEDLASVLQITEDLFAAQMAGTLNAEKVLESQAIEYINSGNLELARQCILHLGYSNPEKSGELLGMYEALAKNKIASAFSKLHNS